MAEDSYAELFVHLIWATHGRRPLIAADIEKTLFRIILIKARQLGCVPRAIGGTEDHVHLLVRLHPAVPLARLAAEAKGVSSHLANHAFQLARPFRWQEGYSAFSVAPREAPVVERYVLHQKERHARYTTDRAWELPRGISTSS